MQFGHENIFNLLVQVYGEYTRVLAEAAQRQKPRNGRILTDLANIFLGANQDVRDYSGRKARQYLASQEAAVSQDTFHSKYTLSMNEDALEKRNATFVHNIQRVRANIVTCST